MAINFPSTPSEGDLYTDPASGDQWEFTNSTWRKVLPEVYDKTYIDSALDSIQTQIDFIDSAGSVGLGNVDNTSDLDKPISTATQTALDGKVDSTDVLTPVDSQNKIVTQSDISNALVDADFDSAGVMVTDGNGIYSVTSISDLGAGDMLTSLYDSNGDGTVNSADNATTVNNLTVETAVPLGAVFTDTVYDNSDVDAHLNNSSITSGFVLAWDQTLNLGAGDYSWIPNTNQTLGVIPTTPSDGYVLSWDSSLNGNLGGYAWVAQSTGGTSYTDTDVDSNLNTGTAEDGQVLSWDSAGQDYVWVDQSTGGGSLVELQQRTTKSTSSMVVIDPSNLSVISSPNKTLAAGDYHVGYIDNSFKSYHLLNVLINVPNVWVTIYTDQTSMISDVTPSPRDYNVDPSPGSGVIAEFVSNGSNQSIIVTPSVLGFNIDNPVSNKMYIKIQNTSTTASLSGAYDVTLTVLQLEK